MSKKTLLNEATVRRFMKLADTQGLADNFINEYGGMPPAKEDEPEDMMDEPMDEEPMDDMAGEEMPADEMPGDEGPEDKPMDDMADDADEVEISEDERDVLAKAAKIMMKIGGGDMGMDMDMGDEAGMMDAMEEDYHAKADDDDHDMKEGSHAMKDDDGEMNEGHGMGHDDDKIEEMGHKTAGKDDDDMVGEGEELDEVNIMDENQLVQEVTKRVAERLRAAIKARK